MEILVSDSSKCSAGRKRPTFNLGRWSVVVAAMSEVGLRAKGPSRSGGGKGLFRDDGSSRGPPKPRSSSLSSSEGYSMILKARERPHIRSVDEATGMLP